MKLLSTSAVLFLGLIPLAPSATAQRPVQMLERFENAIHDDARTGLSQMDGIFAEAEQRLTAMQQDGMPTGELRGIVREADADLQSTTVHADRGVEGLFDEGSLDVLREGGNRGMVDRLAHTARNATDAVDDEELILERRLEATLDRLS